LIGQAELTERQAGYAQRYRQASFAAGHTQGRRQPASSTLASPPSRPAPRSRIASGATSGVQRQRYFKKAVADGLLTVSENPTVEEAMRNVSLIVGDPDHVAAELEGFCRALG